MGLVVKVHVEGGRAMLQAFRDLPKEASEELREANQELSDELAQLIKSAATSSSPQSALIAPTVKAKKDRVPFVQAGGRKRAGSQSRRSIGQDPTTVSDLMFGANFGAHRMKQFRPVTKPDYWFFATVEKAEPDIARRWTEAADRVLRGWGAR